MNNNFGTLFNLFNLDDYSNKQTTHCNTRFFEPINAITPFEQVLAVPDLEFLARFHRQWGRKIIKEQLWWFGCGPR